MNRTVAQERGRGRPLYKCFPNRHSPSPSYYHHPPPTVFQILLHHRLFHPHYPSQPSSALHLPDNLAPDKENDDRYNWLKTVDSDEWVFFNALTSHSLSAPFQHFTYYYYYHYYYYYYYYSFILYSEMLSVVCNSIWTVCRGRSDLCLKCGLCLLVWWQLLLIAKLVILWILTTTTRVCVFGCICACECSKCTGM